MSLPLMAMQVVYCARTVNYLVEEEKERRIYLSWPPAKQEPIKNHFLISIKKLIVCTRQGLYTVVIQLDPTAAILNLNCQDYSFIALLCFSTWFPSILKVDKTIGVVCGAL
jgi:hypothetical protein